MVVRQLFSTVFVIVLMFSFLPAQDTTKTHPCEQEFIQTARTDGLREVPVYRIPQLMWQLYQCRKSGGISPGMKAMEKRQLDEDFARSRSFKGWTVTCASATALVVTMFYIEYLFIKQ